MCSTDLSELEWSHSMLTLLVSCVQAMARDEENYYQDTPKQIARKIRVFRSIPEQYSAYLASKAAL